MTTSDSTTPHRRKRMPKAPDGYWYCPRCEQLFELNEVNFNRDKHKKNGFANHCRACQALYWKEYYERNREKISKNKKEWSSANPDKVKAQKKRSHERCKEKNNARSAKWMRENRERVREYDRIYYRENIDKVKERVRIWNEANPERVRARNQRNYYADIERSRAAKRGYKPRNPVHYRAVVQAAKTRRVARQRGLPDVFSAADWRRALDYFEHKCAVCGRPAGLWHKLSADHWIPLSSPNCPGTVVTNIVPLCHGLGGCNTSKQDKDAAEWLALHYAKRDVARILKRITDYFEWVVANP